MNMAQQEESLAAFDETQLRCPTCGDPLSQSPATTASPSYECTGNPSHQFPVVGGVPLLLNAKLIDNSLLDHDRDRNRTDHDNWKRMQAWYHDSENSEAGRTEYELGRPFDGPAILRQAALFDLQAATRLVGTTPSGLWLSLCCGRGMDAEFLGRQGHTVVGVDISPTSVRIASARLKRRQLHGTFYCADAERLPFVDQAFDGALVYDGLHHLPNPYVAAAEMARVARRYVVIIEPNDSPVVRLLQGLHVSKTVEESGNIKTLFSSTKLKALFQSKGFETSVGFSFHKKWHFPSPWMKHFEGAKQRRFVELALWVSARLAGRFGNHIVFVAKRMPIRGGHSDG
jgi:SAM-dependent methyltransferase